MNQLNAQTIDEIKKELLEEKERIFKEHPQLKNSTSSSSTTTAFPEYGDDEEENANEVADYAANLSVEEDFAKLFRDINSSLKRIEEGTYGICKYCQKPIDPKRLKARPTSSSCVECKKAITQEI
jgi:DnaK suppressor protein